VSAIKPITIVGGGLAGLTLGIGLRRLKIPVTIWEAGHYPRHRVCGEFVSGRGQEVLRRFGLMEAFMGAGATLSNTAGFFLGSAKSPVRRVDPPALCLSRFTMDRLLADLFKAEGGDLRENARWETEGNGESIVRANGRRVQPMENGWRWFGLKVHAREVELAADLEMHGLGHGYVGLCRLPRGEVNVCGLFRARPGGQSFSVPAKELLKGASGTLLRSRMATAVFEEASFCSVAGLPLRPQRSGNHDECRLGDALTMIPPVSGNGMSMAFEAAELALEPISRYARGEVSWQDACRMVARACDTAFRKRLAWAQWLQAMMFSTALHGRLGGLALRSDWLWHLLFTRTR
jgi:2-polyprenyl-6-methoxyphenol hydroxylase-like FAD-dependent oxidoreductase